MSPQPSGIEQRPNGKKFSSNRELQVLQQMKNAKIGFRTILSQCGESQYILVLVILFWTVSSLNTWTGFVICCGTFGGVDETRSSFCVNCFLFTHHHELGVVSQPYCAQDWCKFRIVEKWGAEPD